MKRSSALVISTLLAAALSATDAAAHSDALIYGVDADSNLIRFRSSAPGQILHTVPISGLFPGEAVMGIDFRPLDGVLYALGNSSRLYTVNPITGAATRVGTGGLFSLSGSAFGLDFNPVVDRVRITSDADQNLRVNPADGTLSATDSALAYGSGDPSFGLNPSIIASAYNNNDPMSTVTTLYGIDSTTNTLVIQNPPNAGVLGTVGPLGVDVGTAIGFDIRTVHGTNTGYASFVVGGVRGLYSIDLDTGSAMSLGTIGAPAGAELRSLAVSPGGGLATDFERNNRSAIAWRDTETGQLALWFMNGGTIASTAFYGVPTSWTFDGTGDFNGDGRGDILWRQPGLMSIWFMNGPVANATFSPQFIGPSGPVVAIEDINGDGRADIVKRVCCVYPAHAWLMNGSASSGERALAPPSNWRFEAAADFDADGISDLLWRDPSSGATALWFMNGSADPTTTAFFSVPLEWEVVGTGDIDGDADADILWRRPSTGDLAIWFMDGPVVSSTAFFNVPTTWVFMGTGDFDGDGKEDLLWRNPTGALAAIWFMSGPGITSTAFYGVNFNWSIVAPLR